ncbi:MAG: flagellar basal body rod protein FlgB [Chitinispirillales bacterium]|nr:flagellar basal body rod protein FlgB [Chitinispirillales bacterium]
MLHELIMGGNKNAALAKSLDARAARQKVIVNNIANVETPGYHRKEVKFEESLAEALDRSRLQGARTNGKHFELGRPKVGDVQFEVIEPVDHTMSSGVNNVDIDFEMAQLAENQIGFSYAMKLLKSSHDKLNSAIQGQSLK